MHGWRGLRRGCEDDAGCLTGETATLPRIFAPTALPPCSARPTPPCATGVAGVAGRCRVRSPVANHRRVLHAGPARSPPTARRLGCCAHPVPQPGRGPQPLQRCDKPCSFPNRDGQLFNGQCKLLECDRRLQDCIADSTDPAEAGKDPRAASRTSWKDPCTAASAMRHAVRLRVAGAARAKNTIL